MKYLQTREKCDSCCSSFQCKEITEKKLRFILKKKGKEHTKSIICTLTIFGTFPANEKLLI